MSERLLRHKLESVYGVRSAVHVRGSHVSTAAVAGSPGPAAPSYRKPQRRELSLRVAALAYTWAAIERRARA